MATEPLKNKPNSLVTMPKKMEILPDLIDPEKQVEFASKAARALVSIMENKAKKVIMNGEQYLEFEDWQTIARFYNYTVGADWTKEVNREGRLAGFEAKANVYNAQGVMISSAEASCLRDEMNWKTKPEFQLKSMAQTRASAKALRNVLAWVVVLAGYKPTPAEEMQEVFKPEAKPIIKPKLVVHAEIKVPEKEIMDACSDCKKPITTAVSAFSQRVYNQKLCLECQTKYKKNI